MENQSESKVGKTYLYSVLAFMLILPLLSVLIDYRFNNSASFWMLIGKWFLFWAVGVRLFIAGLRQIFNPAFTAKEIFHLNGDESFVIIRELGFATLCFGTISIVSLFVPQWRIVAAIQGGMFYGLAGAIHVIKKPAGANEFVAMVSDIFIALVMFGYAAFYLLAR